MDKRPQVRAQIKGLETKVGEDGVLAKIYIDVEGTSYAVVEEGRIEVKGVENLKTVVLPYVQRTAESLKEGLPIMVCFDFEGPERTEPYECQEVEEAYSIEIPYTWLTIYNRYSDIINK